MGVLSFHFVGSHAVMQMQEASCSQQNVMGVLNKKMIVAL